MYDLENSATLEGIKRKVQKVLEGDLVCLESSDIFDRLELDMLKQHPELYEQLGIIPLLNNTDKRKSRNQDLATDLAV